MRFRNYIFVLVIMLMMTFNAQAEPKDRLSRYKEKRKRMTEVYERLNLSDDQKQALEQNREKHHGRLRSVKDEIDQTKFSLQEELTQDEVNVSKVEELKGRLKNLQGEATELRVEGMIEVREIMTQEQYEKFREINK